MPPLFISDEARLWVQYLPPSEFWYNSAFHSAIGMPLFQALYGCLPLDIHATYAAPPKLLQRMSASSTLMHIGHSETPTLSGLSLYTTTSQPSLIRPLFFHRRLDIS